MPRPRLARIVTVTLMALGAAAGVVVVFLLVAGVAGRIEPGEAARSDAMFVLIQIVLLPFGLALGAAAGGSVARGLVGAPEETDATIEEEEPS